MRVYAPFTKDQVSRLNAWQRTPWVHPFTCPNRNDGNHKDKLHDELGVLLATTFGWRCPDCEYTLDWAHDFMADEPTPHNPLANLVVENESPRTVFEVLNQMLSEWEEDPPEEVSAFMEKYETLIYQVMGDAA